MFQKRFQNIKLTIMPWLFRIYSCNLAQLRGEFVGKGHTRTVVLTNELNRV